MPPDIGAEDYTPPSAPDLGFSRIASGAYRVEISRPGGATWNVTSDVVGGSVTNVVTNETDSASVELRDPDGSKGYATLFQDRDILKVWTGRDLAHLVHRFSGPILGRPVNLDGAWRRVAVGAQDYSALLHSRMVAEFFLDTDTFGGKPSDIIKHLIDTYASDFTYNNVDDCPVIIQMIGWKYESLFQAIQQIADITNWDWFVDVDKDLHFFDRKADPSRIPVTTIWPDANVVRGTADFNPDSSKLVNRIYVLGGKYLTSTPYAQRLELVANQKEDFLAYKPYYDQEKLPPNGVITDVLPTVYDITAGEPGTQKLVGIEGKANFTDCDVKIEPETRRILWETAPGAGKKYLVTFKHYVPVIEAMEDVASVTAYGGDPVGLYEKVITNEQIEDRRMARALARIELRKYAREYWRGGCRLWTDDAGAGKIAEVTIPELGINQDMLVRSVTRSFAPPAHYAISVALEEEVAY